MAVECLNELPDDVLSLISSSLGLRDAVRLGFVLFGRKQLWKSLVNLNFSFPSMFGLDSPSSFVPEKEYSDKLSERRSEFVGAVDMFLDHHAGIRVETFSVDFTFGEAHACLLNRWLHFAVASGCKELNLNLKEVTVPFRFIFVDFCEFPLNVATDGQASSIVRLSLSSCLLRPPRDFGGFSHLKVLRLHIVSILESDLEAILSKCFTLEHLTLSWCFWWDYLRISNPSANLKYLGVSGCDGLLKIEISAANLVTFEYKGPRETHLIVKNAPHLVRASIHVYPTFEDHDDNIIFALSSNLPQLKTLFLHFNPMDEVRFFKFGKFTNLKNLVVNAVTLPNRDFLWPVVLLKAAPFIEKLQLNLYPGDEVEMFVEEHEINREMVKPSCCPHYHLKEVEITGYTGYTHEIELAMFLFSNATSLNLMVIDPRQKYYTGDHKWRYLRCSEEARTCCLKSYPMLLAEVPSGVTFVVR